MTDQAVATAELKTERRASGRRFVLERRRELEDAFSGQERRKSDRRSKVERRRQIELTSEVGSYLDGVVRRPMVRALVRLARTPAHAAGFGLLQEFLERGLNAFEAMHGAQEFLETMRTCKVYDYAAHRWCDYDGTPLTPPLLEREVVAGVCDPGPAPGSQTPATV